MASLLLGDLNDYIEPSQACIKLPTTEPDNDDSVVKVNLTDCLACAGCITSAETVLVAQQTYHLLIDQLERNRTCPEESKIVVISISPQTRAALAARYKLDILATARKLTTFFKRIGATAVFDTTFSQGLALIYTAKEFVERRKCSQLPLLASACPGWICYAEKKHPELLPYVSSTKSSQQIMGSLVKNLWLDSCPSSSIFHASVMPCYDRKLEAFRNDFYDDSLQSRDVDCVITTSELISLFVGYAPEGFSEIAEAPCLDSQFTSVSVGDDGQESLLGHLGNGSGGYLEYVLSHAAKTLFGIDSNLATEVVKNQDYREYILKKDGQNLLCFASVYGFRNIQTFVTRQRSGKLYYDFVEVMACPGGCLFGGGQPKLVESGNDRQMLKELQQLVDTLYRSAASCNDAIDAHPSIQYIAGISNVFERFFSTQYHAANRSENEKKRVNRVQW